MQSTMLDAAGHRRSPVTMPGYHRGRPPRNKGEQYPADPPTVEEIVAVMRSRRRPSSGPPATSADRAALARRTADQRGARAPGERSGPPLAAPYSSGAGKAASDARSEWTAGHGTSSTRGSRSAEGSRSAQCSGDPRTDRRPPLESISRTQTTPLRGGSSGCTPAVRATPAAARARSRDGARGSPARRDPAPARARQPRDHEHLPPGHRQLGDHQHRPPAAVADDLSHRRPPTPPIARAGSGRPVQAG